MREKRERLRVAESILYSSVQRRAVSRSSINTRAVEFANMPLPDSFYSQRKQLTFNLPRISILRVFRASEGWCEVCKRKGPGREKEKRDKRAETKRHYLVFRSFSPITFSPTVSSVFLIFCYLNPLARSTHEHGQRPPVLSTRRSSLSICRLSSHLFPSVFFFSLCPSFFLSQLRQSRPPYLNPSPEIAAKRDVQTCVFRFGRNFRTGWTVPFREPNFTPSMILILSRASYSYFCKDLA